VDGYERDATKSKVPQAVHAQVVGSLDRVLKAPFGWLTTRREVSRPRTDSRTERAGTAANAFATTNATGTTTDTATKASGGK